MEKLNWKVEGMTCANCALSISSVLEKEGMQDVSVNAVTGDVAFKSTDANGSVEKAKEKIKTLGYTIVDENTTALAKPAKKWLETPLQKFWLCLPFTLVLMLGHLGVLAQLHFLHNPVVQLLLCLPVYVTGMSFFGKSAVNSIRAGVPNMNVLIALGATAAFVYSIIGLLQGDASKIFFETAASIITIVFFGNWMEDAAIGRTQKEINSLIKKEKVMANMIAYDEEHNEHIFPVENTQLKVGDLLLIKTGEQVPMDSKILSGEAEVNESVITGESVPVLKSKTTCLLAEA